MRTMAMGDNPNRERLMRIAGEWPEMDDSVAGLERNSIAALFDRGEMNRVWPRVVERAAFGLCVGLVERAGDAYRCSIPLLP